MSKLHIKLDIQRFAATLTLTASETNTDTATNTSTVVVTCTIKRTSGSTNWAKPYYRTLTLTCGNQSSTHSTELPTSKTTATYSTTFYNVPHNADGTGSVSYTADLAATQSLPRLTASGTLTLTTIPRYFSSSPTLTLISKTENSATFKWTTPENCDQVQYKIGSGSWINVSGTGTSGTYTVTGLTVNTPYTFYGDYKRADSQLWSTAGGYTVSCPVTTHDYPKPTNSPSFTIGNSLNINVSNPLNRQISLELISNVDNSSVIGTYSGTGNGSVEITLNDDLMYQTIPNNPNGTYYAKVTCSATSSTKTFGNGTYTVNANDCKPIMSTVTYADANAITLALTGDNQILINNYSTIQVTIPANNKATARKYSHITGYRIENGLDSSAIIPEEEGEDIVLTITATSSIIKIWAIDSREQSGSYEIANATLINYTPIEREQNPIAQRCDNTGTPNGVGEYVKITLDGTFWNDTFGDVTNSIQTATYQYKNNQSSGDPEPGETILSVSSTNNEYEIDQLILGDTEHGFDVGNSYTIWVTVGDELSTTTFTMTLGSGTPHIAYSPNGVSIMGKYNEQVGGLFQVGGQALPEVKNTQNNSQTDTYSCNYINSLIDMFYPVGSYYETSDTTFNPNTAWGGTWVEDSKGRFLLANGVPEANTDSYFGSMSGRSWSAGVGSRGGQDFASNPLSSNGWAKIQIRSTNEIQYNEVAVGQSNYWTTNYKINGTSAGSSSTTGYYGAALGGKTDVGNNMPPYVGVKRWHRTA